MTLNTQDPTRTEAPSIPAPSLEAVEPPIEVPKPWGREVI